MKPLDIREHPRATRPPSTDSGRRLTTLPSICHNITIVGLGVTYALRKQLRPLNRAVFFMPQSFLDNPTLAGGVFDVDPLYSPPAGHWERTKRCACADSGCRLTDPAQPCPAIDDDGIEHWRLAKLIAAADAAPDNEEIAKELRRVIRECTPFDWLWIRVYDKDEAA